MKSSIKPNNIDQKVIEHLCWLARIELSHEEKEKMLNEIKRVLTLVNKLLEAPVAEEEPLYHVIEKEGLLREDKPSESLRQHEAIQNASQVENGYIVAPRPLEE